MIDLDLADDEEAEEEDAEDSTTLLIPITGTVAAEVAVQVEEEAVAEVEEEVQEEYIPVVTFSTCFGRIPLFTQHE